MYPLSNIAIILLMIYLKFQGVMASYMYDALMFSLHFCHTPYTLPKFNSKSPWKNDAWKTIYTFLLGFGGNFSGGVLSCETSASCVISCGKKNASNASPRHTHLPFVAALPAQLPNSRRRRPDLSTAFGFPHRPQPWRKPLADGMMSWLPWPGQPAPRPLKQTPNLVVGWMSHPPWNEQHFGTLKMVEIPSSEASNFQSLYFHGANC